MGPILLPPAPALGLTAFGGSYGLSPQPGPSSPSLPSESKGEEEGSGAFAPKQSLCSRCCRYTYGGSRLLPPQPSSSLPLTSPQQGDTLAHSQPLPERASILVALSPKDPQLSCQVQYGMGLRPGVQEGPLPSYICCPSPGCQVK